MELRIARLTKPHGLKGGLKVELSTDEPDRRFAPGAVLHMQVPEASPWRGKSLTVRQLSIYNGHPVAFFEEIVDRDQAESAAKAILYIDQDEQELPDEPEAWYDHQLVGLTVNREGVPIGKVVRVDHLPGQDLLAIQAAVGEVLLPFVHAFVPAIDLAGGELTITPPGGLFEPADDGGDGPDDNETGTPRKPEPEAPADPGIPRQSGMNPA